MTREIMLGFGKDAMELHDIVAVWCAIDNPPVANEGVDGMPTLEKGWKSLRRVFDIERSHQYLFSFYWLAHRSNLYDIEPES
jgi:hypothetical protein